MRKAVHRFLAVFTILLLVLVLASLASAAAHWKQKYVRFSATAGETVATGNVVCIKSDGLVYKADSDDSTLRPAVGVIGKGGATNATVEIVVEGIITGQTAVTPGFRVYLSETAGAMTTTAPTNAQPIGWVLPGDTSATLATSGIYYVKIQMPVSTGAGY